MPKLIWLLPSAAVAILAWAYLGHAPGISAVAFHGYSVAYENSVAHIPFTGVNEVRNDAAIQGIPNDGCQVPIDGTPVYQPEWVILTQDSQNWVEQGSGHQCNDTFRYWYWGYGVNGIWHTAGWRAMGPGPLHRFYIYQTSNCWWSVNVDVTQVGTFQHCGAGVKVEAGLESYVNVAVVPSNNVDQLAYSQNFAPYASFDGRDAKLVTASMCGFWRSNTKWANGENTAC